MSISLKSVDFEWPNGQLLFTDLNLNLASEAKYGLVGHNGAGKSTLARLVSGALQPTRGAVECDAQVAYFSQSEVPPASSLEDYLGNFWIDVRPADAEVLQSLSSELPMERACGELSGGQWMKARLITQIARGASFIILDEPTNHLDREAREALMLFFESYSGGLLVISHDRELLEYVDSILELSVHGIAVYGGGWSLYEEERNAERSRQEQRHDRLKREASLAKREMIRKTDAQEKRLRAGKKRAPKLGVSRLILGDMKRRAAVSLGKIKSEAELDLSAAKLEAKKSFDELKADPTIYAKLSQPKIPGSKLILEALDFNFRFAGMSHDFWRENLTFSLKGARKLAIKGENGSGKSMLLRLLTTSSSEIKQRGNLRLGSTRFGFIDQEGTALREELSVFENVMESAELSESEVRQNLAQFLFPAVKADQVVKSLSGGERVRVSLAKALIMKSSPELLILDEPTNNLDIANLEFLEAALRGFDGAILIVSHDEVFLKRAQIEGEVKLIRR